MNVLKVEESLQNISKKQGVISDDLIEDQNSPLLAKVKIDQDQNGSHSIFDNDLGQNTSPEAKEKDPKPQMSETKIASIQASDKQMEIAFRTNDVFSSQRDEDDDIDLPLGFSSPPQRFTRYESKDAEALMKQATLEPESATLPQMQARIMTYKIPVGIGPAGAVEGLNLEQQKTSNDQIRAANEKFFSS